MSTQTEPAGAAAMVWAVEMTNATTTATTTSGVTETPSAPSNRVASNVEVNGSRNIGAHMAPMPMPIAGARLMPGKRRSDAQQRTGVQDPDCAARASPSGVRWYRTDRPARLFSSSPAPLSTAR